MPNSLEVIIIPINTPDPLHDKKTIKALKSQHIKDGINSIFLFQDETENRPEQCINLIKSKTGESTIKVNARDCEAKQIDKATCRAFIDKNHIQSPSALSIVSFGLFLNDELIGIISGGKHHRDNTSKILVLERMCFSDGYTIRGGASRLLKRLVAYANENFYDQILSWSDNRISEGNVYKVLGFELANELPGDYSYIKNGERFSKQSFKKSSIQKKHPEIYSPEKTESQMMIEAGYIRVWDLGKKTWVINLI